MTTPRIVIKPLRVTDLSDPKVASIQNGEGFIVENAGSTEQYYKRFTDGALVKLSSGDGEGGAAIDWNSIGNKPTTFYTLPSASSVVLGGVKIGSGLSVAVDGTIAVSAASLSAATSNAAGVVKVGSGLSVTSDGTLSASAQALTPATANALGGVKIGSGLSVTSDGTLTATGGSSGGTGNATVQEFTVNFTGAAPGSVSGMPSGWSASINGTIITVTHNMGKPLKQINYWGYSAAGGVERYRLPSASNEVTIPYANRNSQFVFTLSTSVAGADTDGTARVVVAF
jgi:hypothetical protein